MWFWNRVEVYCGYSMKDFSELRDVLAANGLKYDYRLVNPCGNGQSRVNSLGINPDYQTQYYLYVHRNEYENAMYLMQNRKNHL